MGLTVEAIYNKFPDFKGSDMVNLVGSSNFQGNTVISSAKIASWNGAHAKEMSVWLAEKEGESFVNMLRGSKQKSVSETTGVVAQNNSAAANPTNNKKIPMNVSIFNIPQENMA